MLLVAIRNAKCDLKTSHTRDITVNFCWFLSVLTLCRPVLSIFFLCIYLLHDGWHDHCVLVVLSEDTENSFLEPSNVNEGSDELISHGICRPVKLIFVFADLSSSDVSFCRNTETWRQE